LFRFYLAVATDAVPIAAGHKQKQEQGESKSACLHESVEMRSGVLLDAKTFA
jgi:hypothetical protein